MIITTIFKSKIPKSIANELNQASAAHYNAVLVSHWRVWRKKDIWLSPNSHAKIEDAQSPTILHAHSRDAAQQGFYKACKTTKALKRVGIEARYPHKRRKFRTTVWKSTGVRIKDGLMLLARARGLDPIFVKLPKNLVTLAKKQVKEVRLVFNQKRRVYDWHVCYDDGLETPDPPGSNIAAIDLGEIHPAVVSDKTQAVVFSARELRSIVQYRCKKQAVIKSLQSKCQKRSRRWWRLQDRWNKIKGHCDRKIKDICHKVSRAVVDWAKEREVGTLVIGDVRNISNGVSLSKKVNQKISGWTHGTLRRFITYKANREGIKVKLQEESYTSQTCPNCGNRHKPRGRVYRCLKCQWVGHRDGQVGSPNILSKYEFGEPGRILVNEIKYRYPFLTGKRSLLDTEELAYG